jgi:hypothetical protein
MREYHYEAMLGYFSEDGWEIRATKEERAT